MLPIAMSLIEKRASLNVHHEAIEPLEADIKRFCPGSDIHLELDWDSFSSDPNVYRFFSSPGSVRVELFNRALGATLVAMERICCDEPGREALAEQVRTIRFSHVRGLPAGRVAVEGGVITVEADLNDRASGSAAEICQVIEASL